MDVNELKEKLERCEERCRTKSTEISLLVLEALYCDNAENKQYFLEEIMKVAMSEKGYNNLIAKIPRDVQPNIPDAEKICEWKKGVKPEPRD